MEETRTTILLQKFIRNECTAAELLEVEKLIQTGINESIWEQLILEEQQHSAQHLTTISPEHAERIYSRINKHLQSAKKTKHLYPSWLKWSAVAASLILGFFLFYQWSSLTKDPVFQVAATQHHERKHLVMEDSSQIWINNKSSLKYPEEFASGKREVVLEGEAFFEITKDPARPFFVQTGNLSVKVVGTSFNVRSFADEDLIVITLATGKVTIEIEVNTPVTLVPGEQLTYNKRTNRIEKRQVNVAESYAWREGMLIFNSASIQELTRVLERWYGVHIYIKDQQLSQKRITLKQKDESLHNVLEVLSFTAGLDFKVNGDTVTLMKHH